MSGGRQMSDREWKVLGMIASMESRIAGLVSALKPFSFCDAETPPEGVAVDDWRAAVLAARAALAKAGGAA